MYFYRETKIGNFSGKDRFSLSKSERITTDARLETNYTIIG